MLNKPKCLFIVLIFAILCTISPALGSKKLSRVPGNSVDLMASLNESVLCVPGDPNRPCSLQVTVYTPKGKGPFPLAVMNHGAEGNPRLSPRYKFSLAAHYFLSRGYAVALPMMRGYAGSGGFTDIEGCNLEALGINNAKDILAVINYMASQPHIDGNRVVVAGQSFGGWNTLALGTFNDPRVKGLVNFAGGVRVSDCGDTDFILSFAAGHYGANTSAPSIWFYGDNDKLFSKQAWQEMYDSYTEEGGPAELVDYGRFMNDAHIMLGSLEGLPLWVSKLDAFLSKAGLPGKSVYPQYLPATTANYKRPEK